MKHIVITGVSRGLGRAMAIGFVADGWTVSGCGTDTAALQSLGSKIGPDHHVQPCDVTDPAVVEKFAQTSTERFGAPDLLLNNAATINPNAHVSAKGPAATQARRNGRRWTAGAWCGWPRACGIR